MKIFSQAFVRFIIGAMFLTLCVQMVSAQQLIHYWNFNDNEPGSNSNWSQPITSQIGTGQITYTFTEAYSFGGTTINGIDGEVNGGSFAPRGGADMINNGEYFTITAPTTGYENIELKYPTRRTSTGFSSQEIKYTIDGTTWQTKQTIDISGFENNWLASQLITIDFSGITAANNNPDFAIRIVLTGATSSAGNNRFDNIRVSGLMPGAVVPPSNLEAEAISTTQINLNWQLNASNDDVLLAWSDDGVFGEPSGTYNPGDPISGGGTVLYLGSNTAYNHQSLAPGTTYYYKAWSKSGSDYSTGITTSETTDPDPATTTLPYIETFDTDLGDCYVYSVSGDTKYWNHNSSNGTAQMNGFNSGELEQDWLILPGVDLNAYSGEVLTFDTWWQYGLDNADNYLKLFYSTNYFGTGDPSTATWTELSFVQPGSAQTWTSSGNIDLSGIAGDMVYIGFKYYYQSGDWRWWQVDNISITGTPIGTQATQLSITDVNNGISPSANTAFPVTVMALNNDDQPAAVSSDTQVTLSLASGSGTLGGTLTGMILEGQTTVIIQGVTYNTSQPGVSITASATGLNAGTSDPFMVLEAANQLAFVDVPAFGQENTPIAAFTVEARRSDNSVDLNFTGSITLAKASGPGTMAGTLVQDAVAGVAGFNDIEFSEAGTYTMQASSGGLTGTTSSGVVILGEPQITAVLIPEFIMGNNPGNNRLPFAYRATISNLIPNATYKFTNQSVIADDGPTTAGAGNAIYVTASGSFIRSTGTSFTNPDQHHEFVTDANGSFTAWFVTEPTGNARFTPGNDVFMRVRLNDGDGGTSPMHYLTIAESVSVIGMGNDNDPLQGSGVYGKHFSQGKNFAVLYNNADGNGRPLSATFIEDDGSSGGTSYPGFYQDEVDGQEGSWGAIVPNQLPQGLRRVEVRDRISGSLVEGTVTTPDGLWPYGSNTVNPTSGTTGMLITPWPDFIASITNIAPGTDVDFTDLTPGTPSAWNWQFMGGTPGTSTLQNPTVTYYNTGEFDVTLTVTTEFGIETITKTEYINVNELPWPDFSAEPTFVAVDSAVVFTDLSTGNPDTWEWIFEGGTPGTFTGQEPPPVTYAAPGSYDVSLEVTNEWGSNTMLQEDYITVGYAPVADFVGSPTNIIEGETVAFTDLSANEPTSWEWTFEEGTPLTSTLQNPDVIFNTPGSFDVTLTVSNAFGSGSITKTDYIVVEPVGVGSPLLIKQSVRPNPTKGLVIITLPAAARIKVYNSAGIIVFETHGQGKEVSFDLAPYGKGLYIIESIVYDLKEIIRSKVMVQ
jgi:PKD repeat protein